MGLHPERRLDASLARAFRDDVVARLKHKGVERYEILDALDAYPERSDTWISRALNHRLDLSWTTAVELAIRVENRGVKLASSILDDLAEFELALATLPKFARRDSSSYLGFGKVASLRTSHARKLALSVRHLHRLIAVSRLGPDLRHGAGSKLNNGDRHDPTGGIADLRHSQFLTNQSAKHGPTRV